MFLAVSVLLSDLGLLEDTEPRFFREQEEMEEMASMRDLVDVERWALVVEEPTLLISMLTSSIGMN